MRVHSAGPAPAPQASSRGGAGPRRPKSFTAVLDESTGAVGPAPIPPAPPRPPAVARRRSESPAPSPVRALFEQTVGAERRVDALLAAAARGRTFSAGELLALQATVFRYSQAVEIVSRATDKLIGAVKQTMGTQV